MRIDCNAAAPAHGIEAEDHRCGLAPGHDTPFHLCVDHRFSWANTGYRLLELPV